MTARSAGSEQFMVGTTLSALMLGTAVAVFAIDPGTIVDQAALDGAEQIVVVGLPLSVVAAIAALTISPAPTHGALRTGSRLLGVFVAWTLFCSLFSPSPAISIAYAASFACVALAGRTLGRHSPSLLFAALASALPIYLAIAVAARRSGAADSWFFLDRLTFVSLEANQFARFAAVASIAGLYLLVESSAPLLRTGGAAVALVGFGLIPLTDSRTGAASLAVALGILLILRGSRRATLWISVAGIAGIAALIVSPLGNSLTTGLSRAGTSGGASSLTGRTEIWPVVFDQALRQSVTGHGLGADRSIVSGLSFTVGFEIQHAHNLLLHLFLTTGIIGVGVFIALVWWLLGSPGATARTATNPWAVALTAFVVLDGVSEPVLQNPTASWLAIVAATVLTERAQSSHDASRALARAIGPSAIEHTDRSMTPTTT